MKVNKDASVHEKTVQDAQKHADAHKKPRRRSRPTRKAVTTKEIKVDPRVWKAAFAAAGGDPSRLKIISATEVLVVNGTR